MGLLRGGRGNDIAMTDATTPETPAPQQPVTVGARLRAAREAQGLSVADVASRTRVTQRFLEALEDGDFTNLPSATYASGFARAYARAVGLDPSEIGRDIRAEIVHAALPPRVGDLFDREERYVTLPATFDAVTAWIAERATPRA